jgi:annexin A7/11
LLLPFEEISGADIEFSIKREFTGNVEVGFLGIGKINTVIFGMSETLNLTFSNCVKSKLDLAERSHDSIAGMGTKDKTLIRIIVSRSEIDLEDMKETFENKYGKSLESWIKVCGQTDIYFSFFRANAC